MPPQVLIKRGTRSQIDAAAAANGLAAGEPYLITDEDRLAVGLGAATYQDFAKPGELPAYAFANLPSASAHSGELAIVTDAGKYGSLWRSTGTSWRPLHPILLEQIRAPVSIVSGTGENLYVQAAIPAGVLIAGSDIELDFSVTKSGSSETMSGKVRIGSEGTTGDTALTTISALPVIASASNRRAHVRTLVRIDSTTSAMLLHGTPNQQYPEGQTSVVFAADTIPNTASNTIYVSLGLYFSASTETGSLVDARMILHR
jgi:hypothetical protein